ncbi:hypothetical protein, partial [Methylocaldum sp.]|uniref:hypothetical protein n=1 Tax=Methylocaldum sp. TaxID=1969727 RepID=UPI00321F999D
RFSRDPSNRKRRLRERRSRPSRRCRWGNGFVGKGLPTYECLNLFTRAEGANDSCQACFAVRAR